MLAAFTVNIALHEVLEAFYADPSFAIEAVTLSLIRIIRFMDRPIADRAVIMCPTNRIKAYFGGIILLTDVR